MKKRNKRVYFDGKEFKWNGEFHYLCSMSPSVWLQQKTYGGYKDGEYYSPYDCQVKVKGQFLNLIYWVRNFNP